MGLQQFERRLERLVEGVFTKALRSGLQPVEIARKLTREIDAKRTHGVHGLIAPNAFTITIAPADRERFGSFEQALITELADAAREHARDEGYHFIGPVTVELLDNPRYSPGMCDIAAEIVASGGGRIGTIVMRDGRRVPIGEDPVVIGRMPDCQIALADPEASRRHAQVVRTPEAFAVQDLGSTNGTSVNGARITEHTLSDGDEIKVGSTILRFEAS